MMIVIPMAGLSSRFFKAGYGLPKYMLEAKGKTLFDHAIESFHNYFNDQKFVFIVRDVYDTAKFVSARAKAMGILDFEVVVLDFETKGQAETVALGLTQYRASSMSITIFNIDTFRPMLVFPFIKNHCDGYLEVFQGDGDNWSFVRPQVGTTQAELTAEKRPISNLCCTGLYHFGSVALFFEAYDHYLSLPKREWEKGELYVAPLYNYLIAKGKSIHYHEIARSEVIFCGVPQEYIEFIDT